MTAQTYLVKDGVGNTITLNADGSPSGLTPRHGIESNGAAVTTANPLQVGGTLTLAFPTVAAGGGACRFQKHGQPAVPGGVFQQWVV